MIGAQLDYPQISSQLHFHKPRYGPLKFAFHGTYVKIQMYTDIPKTKKFGCVGRGDLTILSFSKVVK